MLCWARELCVETPGTPGFVLCGGCDQQQEVAMHGRLCRLRGRSEPIKTKQLLFVARPLEHICALMMTATVAHK
jgi:hypothetical protein